MRAITVFDALANRDLGSIDFPKICRNTRQTRRLCSITLPVFTTLRDVNHLLLFRQDFSWSITTMYVHQLFFVSSGPFD